MKIVWLSRHELTDEQLSSLKKKLGIKETEQINIETMNVTWDASISEENDICKNTETWILLLEQFDIITGVFPPVALESLKKVKKEFLKNSEILTPISGQVRSERKEGVNIPFVHLRWSFIK